MTYSAAAAYFAVFSLPGLLIIVVSMASFFFDEEFVRTQIVDYMGNFIGPDVAKVVGGVIDNARLNENGLLPLLVGGSVLMFGATGLFNQLKTSFNIVWNVRAKPEKTWLRLIVNRAVSLGVAISIGCLLLMSMYLSTVSKIYGNWIAKEFPDFAFISSFEALISFLTIVLVFALIFKVLPDIRIKLRYALAGGFVSSVLFTIGEAGFAKILEHSSPHSAFGAAGSIVLLMIWITFACMILQFGAEFIKALMTKYENEIKTTRFVRRLD